MRTETLTTIKKTVRIGRVTEGNVYCRITFESGKLSITGVIGPMRNGDAKGGCGQIDGSFQHRNPEHDDARTSNPYTPAQIEFADGWNVTRWFDFLEAWKLWHLNDMRAGCVHQTAAGWANRPIDATKPTTAYGKHFEGQQQDSWNMLTWVSRSEHPDGLLSHHCPECGYKYGTAWLKQDVPQSVLEFLDSLPDTDVQPAWV